MNTQIMVSYSTRDKDLPQLKALLEDLQSLDRSFWYDRHLHEGFSWWAEITDQIAKCQIVVIALTTKWMRSEACKRELGHAIATGRRILPVRMADLPETELPQALRTTQMVQYVNRLDDAATAGRCVAKLGTAIDALLSLGVLPAASNVTPPPIPPSYIDPLLPYITSDALDFDQQRRMVDQAEDLVNDDEDDRRALRKAVQELSDRRDTSWKVRTDLHDLLARIDANGSPDQAGRRGFPQAVRRSKPQAHRGHSFSIPAVQVDVRRLAEQLERWYQAQGLETETTHGSTPGAMIVLCRSRARARRTGVAVALTVELEKVHDTLAVSINNKWRNTAASFGGAFVASVATGGALLPLMAAPAVGGYRQVTLANKTADYITSIAGAA